MLTAAGSRGRSVSSARAEGLMERAERDLRILSYNIHKGFSQGNRRFVLERIRQVLEITNADIVFLQEVLGEHTGHASRVDEWPAQPQFEYIAEKLWPGGELALVDVTTRPPTRRTRGVSKAFSSSGAPPACPSRTKASTAPTSPDRPTSSS